MRKLTCSCIFLVGVGVTASAGAVEGERSEGGAPRASFPETTEASNTAEKNAVVTNVEQPVSGALPAGLADFLLVSGKQCDYQAWEKQGSQLLVACGAAGLWTLEREAVSSAFRIVEKTEMTGSVVGFSRRGENVIVLTEAKAVKAPAVEEPAPESVEKVENREPAQSSIYDYRQLGVVQKVGARGLISVRVGLGERSVVGAQVAIRHQQGEEDVIGVVEKVTSSELIVEIGMSEKVAVGDEVWTTTKPVTGSLMAPPLGDYTWAWGLDLKPWLGLNQSDSGLLLQGFVSMRSDWGRFVASVQPAVIPLGSRTPGAVDATIGAHAVFKYAEFGLALGVATMNEHFANPPGTGLVMMPSLRLGTEDGLHVRLAPSFVVHRKEYRFGSFRIQGQIPIAWGTSLLLGGGGGDSGYYVFDLGLRRLLVGNGGAGTWFGQIYVGGAGSTKTTYWTSNGSFMSSNESSSGPMIGLGVENRF